MGAAVMNGTRQTTLRLPEKLYRKVKGLVEKREVEASSVNDLIVTALQNLVDAVRDKQIDAAFAEMGKDQEYLAESRALAQEFAQADLETLPSENWTSRATKKG
ncbi:MAG TPA: hypothetical protein VMU53_16225 [Candidatus Sulfotelmatobacter sp.]|nr:hypothetical protein [Candidatus Sulfotelmatobacter sp.]